MTTLVSQVSSAYFGLRALDLELDISRRTLASRQESLQLTQVRERGGVTSLVDVRQAEQLVYGATGEIATLEREIEQQENFISVLLGDNPGPIARGRALDRAAARRPTCRRACRRRCIERRPDIQQAEQQLVAANAQIGVARSAYFPQIALTGSGGFESTALAALFTGTNAIWTAAATATQPIFTAGRTRSQVAVAAGAARGGGDRLPADDSAARSAKCRTRWSATASCGSSASSRRCCSPRRRTRRRLAEIRYEGGATSYLEVLDADTRLFDARARLGAGATGRSCRRWSRSTARSAADGRRASRTYFPKYMMCT